MASSRGLLPISMFLLIALLEGCGMRGNDCERLWRALLDNASAQDEAARARAFAACARQHELAYQLSFSNRATGAPIAASEAGTSSAPIAVALTMTIDGKKFSGIWQPQDPKSVFELLAE
jgi:hypothetical protein